MATRKKATAKVVAAEAVAGWTDDSVRRLPVVKGGQKKYWRPGQPGFGVRVSNIAKDGSVTRSWIAQHGPLATTIGRVDQMTLKVASAKATVAIEEMKDGVDLVDAKREKSQASARRRIKGRTVGQVCQEFMSQQHFKSDRTPEYYAHLLHKHLGSVANRPIRSITSDDLDKLWERVRKEVVADDYHRGKAPCVNKPGVNSANQAVAAIITLWRWEDHRNGIDARRPFKKLPPTKRRKNAVPVDKLPAFMAHLASQLPALQHKVDMVRLALMTGLRRAAVRGLRWSEVDLEGALLTIPASRMKGRLEPFELPISRQAVALLTARRRAPDADPVFVFADARWGAGFPRDAGEVFHDIETVVGKQVSLHSMRATFITVLTSNGVPLAVRAGLCAHKVEEMNDSYVDLSGPELARWAQRCGDIIEAACTASEAKVVKLAAE